ncbi:MAG TPA: YeeE/YedE thiosulfate transporter family protein [Symbiobacteriaceae bacterium]|nr:YeeE/YedE thiosulfate transporter family protein [Symbiobacteriaceae bacterium]
MTEPMVLGLFLVSGMVAGFAFQRSRLCFVGSLRDLFLFGDTGMTRGALQLLGLVAVFGATAVAWRPGMQLTGPGALDTLLGGGLFGVGMVLAGSCASGAFWRLGEGQGSQLWILLGLLAGTWLWALFPLGGELLAQAPLSPWLSALIIGLLLLAVSLWERTRPARGEELPPLHHERGAWRRPWPPILGAVVIAAALAGFLAATGLTWRLTSMFLLSDAAGALFGLGLVGGGHLSARVGREWRLRGAGRPREGLLRLAGGLLMGYGARLGGGCTIGALLSSMVTSSGQAWFWFAGAVVGAWIGSRVLRRLMTGLFSV